MSNGRAAELTEGIIRSRSYLIWEREWRPQDRALEHWLRARAELETEAGLAFSSKLAGHVPPRPSISVLPRRSVAIRIRSASAAETEDQTLE